METTYMGRKLSELTKEEFIAAIENLLRLEEVGRANRKELADLDRLYPPRKPQSFFEYLFS